ncbi:MAG: AAA-associated domain-containing protein [Thermoplasmata archaeon]|jgi:NitT/TauT family transport system ATP-binding protein|nr:AAA-associated domain-containing protein [Thermoplasmata archaeon]
MPTVFPKCSPSEMIGLLVLLKDHKGAEDVARLAQDLDLEIDEIFPAVEFSELLQFLKVKDGRATLTENGTNLLGLTIRDRKALLREQLKRTTLFKALGRALESSPEKMLTEDEVVRLIDFTTAPADEYVQNIINWGRYTELFRYDSDRRILLPARPRAASRPVSAARPPGGTGGTMPPPSSASGAVAREPARGDHLASVTAAFA